MPRVVCVGANIESEKALEKLILADVDVIGLVTVPPRSDSRISDYRDLHPLCHRYQIPVIDTEDINAPTTVDAIAQFSPEYLYVLGWSQMLKQVTLTLPSEFVIGSHPTPLPARRGRAPIPWTILEGHTQSAVSLFRMTTGVDDGHLLLQRWFDLPERPYALEVYQKVADILAQAFVDISHQIDEGTVVEQIQNKQNTSYRARRIPADGLIDFNDTAEAIDRLIRAVSEPFPGAYTYYKDLCVKIWGADTYTGPEYRGLPGQILRRQKNGLLVQAGDQPLILRNLSLNGQAVELGFFGLGNHFGYRTPDVLADLRHRLSLLENHIKTESS